MGNTISIEKAKAKGREAMLFGMRELTEKTKALRMAEEHKDMNEQKKLELNENSNEKGR